MLLHSTSTLQRGWIAKEVCLGHRAKQMEGATFAHAARDSGLSLQTRPVGAEVAAHRIAEDLNDEMRVLVVAQFEILNDECKIGTTTLSPRQDGVHQFFRQYIVFVGHRTGG